MDNSALDALRSRPQPHASTPAPRRPTARRAPGTVQTPQAASTPPVGRRGTAPATSASPTPSTRAGAKPSPAPTHQAEKPRVPAIPPAILALPPAVAVPLAHPPPIPTVPVADDAPGTASPIQGGLRVTFGADRVDMNPASVAALRAFALSKADIAGASINIFAYAAGSPDDPSTPRRLSLQRALAARAVLLQAGIPSPRIYPRALGPAGGSVDPDRVDVLDRVPLHPAADPRAAPDDQADELPAADGDLPCWWSWPSPCCSPARSSPPLPATRS